ncbi:MULTISPECIES: BglG family transcription antiterminator LicT [Saccharibacillus]|uniref:BglG family transcription antiterminator LicT n=1 Tax=Saccharibacillus TaxID=456492 RepID=UPI001238EA7D|nr:PRD domain-containing protein [Saccharibacillus sp. WB 17]MWJ33561.1 PRD domain-containing protein [Saccharibacillus sp. WB 17]
MIIQKIFNNNAIIASDNGKSEFVVVGRGIAFKRKIGEPVDRDLVEKIFVLQQQDASEKFKLLLEDVPPEYISLCYDIIEYGKNMLDVPLSDYVYVTLTDHMNNALKLLDEGITTTNPLIWEIRRIYPKEFAIGRKALTFIEESLGKKLPEDEAANVAMHLINAQIDPAARRTQSAADQAGKISDILNIIKYTYGTSPDEQSISYERFVTHLRFFFQRIGSSGRGELEDDFLLQQVKSKYKRAYGCMLKVEKYLQLELPDEEKLYLTLHIHRVTRESAP